MEKRESEGHEIIWNEKKKIKLKFTKGTYIGENGITN